MLLSIGDIISELNINKATTSISADDFHNITVNGTDILCVDYVKYYCALQFKKIKFFRGYTIDHRSLNKILKDPIIRKHYLMKKSEKPKDK